MHFICLLIAFVIYQTLLIGQAKKRAQPPLPLHCSQDEVSQIIIMVHLYMLCQVLCCIVMPSVYLLCVYTVHNKITIPASMSQLK